MNKDADIKDLLKSVHVSSTPQLIFFQSWLKKNCLRFIEVCNNVLGPHNYELYFPLKIASCREIAAIVAETGYGVEIIHKNELIICKDLGINNLLISGSYKPPDFLFECIRYGCEYIVCESLDEIKQVDQIAKSLAINQPILLRIKLTTYRRLGFSSQDLLYAIKASQHLKHITIHGLHMHPGTNINDKRADQSIEVFLEQLKACRQIGQQFTHANFGSGLPTFTDNSTSLRQRLKSYMSVCKEFSLKAIIEPGRPLVGDAAILIGEIHQVRSEEKQILIDTACYIVNGPCGSSHEIYLWRKCDNNYTRLIPTKPKCGTWRLGGIWPAEGDSLWLEDIPAASIGDKIIFCQAGAYTIGFVEELSFENMKPLFLV